MEGARHSLQSTLEDVKARHQRELEDVREEVEAVKKLSSFEHNNHLSGLGTPYLVRESEIPQPAMEVKCCKAEVIREVNDVPQRPQLV